MNFEAVPSFVVWKAFRSTAVHLAPLFEEPLSSSSKAALIEGPRSWTWKELRLEVEALAEKLSVQGIGSGCLVAARGVSDSRMVFLAHALWAIRATFLPLNARWTPGETQSALRQAGRAALAEPSEKGDWKISWLNPEAAPFAQEGWPSRASSPEGIQLVLFTSGTSGSPKAALIPFRAIEASARAAALQLSLGADTRWLCCMPLFHTGGLLIVYRSAFYGSTLILHPEFDAIHVNDAIDSGTVTMVSLVPTMLHRLLVAREGKPFPPSLRCILLGGAKASPGLLREARRLGAPVAPTYGLTETASQLCTLPPEEFAKLSEKDFESVPLAPLPGVSIEIRDEKGRLLPPGTLGEIFVRAPMVMSGYLGDPAATERSLPGGTLRTG
ncbi:MAG: AMP-binding protein, partial [Bdellovibrionota bacterium]